MATLLSRKSKKVALKEDIKHILEELWDVETEQPLFKIFTRDCLGARRIHSTLGFSKPELKELS